MAKIIIKRKSSLGCCAIKHDVYLLNTLVGELKSGGTLEIPVEVGTNTILFRKKNKHAGKNATFYAVVNEPDEVVELETYFDMYGNYIVKYNDNKPHIPTYQQATSNQENNCNLPQNTQAGSMVTQQSGLCCPRCGSKNIQPMNDVSSSGKDFKASNAFCGYLLCGPLGLLCGASGKGKQIKTTTYWICAHCGNKFQAYV